MEEAVTRSYKMAKRAQTRQQVDLSRFIMQDKENMCFFPNVTEEPAQRSPLPVGDPRAPLQDITDILSPLNVSDSASFFCLRASSLCCGWYSATQL